MVQRCQNRSIEAAQVMEELVQMAGKFREAAARGEQLSLSEFEVRFYDALAHNEPAVRESAQAKLRLMIKRILRKYKYPPDQQDAAVELVLQKAQAQADA